jgi:hypothetical protein
MKTHKQTEKEIRRLISFFIVALVLSGITAFALETELAWLTPLIPDQVPELNNWITKVHQALKEMNSRFPFLAYGYDWLAFAHLVIAVFFIGPWKDPVRNIWVIQSGIIACVMIFPLAFIAGAVRKIPFYWQLIDCSFGVVGLIPLILCYRKIKSLNNQLKNEITNNAYE